ncbi:cyanophycin synthetase [Niveibacterium sp. 24ML]|uniref:cyanophycin synthetase n=1 Tax=Niveibacterium sp. 24ML TaxID=2985512 RepID=UPI00226EDC74|nr:cyanophycin synthetase [Niveibacterium sp. 24ML]MCX9155205.1 cyanophycin synthetase [Niveibacterium sp. 24ML]
MKKKDITFLRVTHLRGPNIWTYRPVIEALLDIGEFEQYPSNTLPGFTERLTAWLPGLLEHRCGVGERGGFRQRLDEGTWIGHVLEHVVLELQMRAGMQTGFGKTRQTAEGSGLYKMAFRTRNEQVGRAALEAGRELVLAAVEDRPYDLAATIERLTDMVDSLCLGPSTACIVDAATERKIPSIRLNEGNLVQLGYGARQRRIWTAETDRTSAIAESISSDKDLTKSLLASCGVPVPDGRIVENAADAWEAAEDIGLPVVVKPVDGNHGRGVSLDLSTRKDVEEAFALAEQHGSEVIVERFIRGHEHRLLVVGNKVVAVARGEEAWVTGDGSASIAELIDAQLNTDPRRGLTEEFPLNKIIVSEDVAIQLDLSRQGFDANSLPAQGQRVLIQRNGNVAFDCTDELHPELAEVVALAARVVGLDIAGVDLVAEDISRPLAEQDAAVVEVNAGPGLLMHLKPANGAARPVGQAIVNHLFGETDAGRIPLVGVTGRQGTTQISKLVAWLVRLSGRHVGLACAEGMFLDRRQVDRRNGVNFDSGQRLLMNRTVDAAVFEHSAESILREGLPYDRCTVGIVTDVSGHESLSEHYIDSADRLYGVLRTQVDVVDPAGYAVLNAEDEQVAEMAPLCDGKVIFYATTADAPALARHRAAGGSAVFARDGRVFLARGADEERLDELAMLPAAGAGSLEVSSVLAAVGAAWALGMSPDLIGAGIETFEAEQTAARARAH